MLSEDVVNRRIAPMAPYDVNLDPTITDVTTSRTFTSRQWGGNTQSTFPSIRQDMLARHGLNDFMYLNLFFNPHTPQWPGAPGLFFDPSVDWVAHERPGVRRVSVRLKSSCWLYVGQYQRTPAPSLTIEEWKSQAPKVSTRVMVIFYLIFWVFPSGQAEVEYQGLNSRVGPRHTGKNCPPKEAQ